MNIPDFIRKWRNAELTERSASQQHFLDLCELVGHPTPADVDPTGEWFTFEKGASKTSGGDGWADVWKKGFFGWEYKGKHRDLERAYGQLLQYREALQNPPLLVVCDIDRIEVHTNFTNTPVQVHTIALDELAQPRNIEILHAVFHDPDKLRPNTTSQAITAEAARSLADVAHTMRSRGLPSADVAHMLDRIIFCLFAEDVRLLPEKLFTRIVENAKDAPARFARLLGQLFIAMAHGGDFGADSVPFFNGNLFDDVTVLEMTPDEIKSIHAAAQLDWAAVDPSIFGTLFERGLDPDKRSQLGAHYTSREDIETLVEPVVMQPLRREWDELRKTIENLLTTGRKTPRSTGVPPVGSSGTGVPPVNEASGSNHGRDGRATGGHAAEDHGRDGRATKERAMDAVPRLTPAQARKARREALGLIQRFLHRLQTIKILDPACGSGNFLYVTLQKLLDLEKEVILYAMDRLQVGLFPGVRPEQLYGIEINRYAHELAQMVVWIGYLQWRRQNGFVAWSEPILTRMDNFQCRDAILDLSDTANPREPEWPAVDFIVGNPPFLGSKMMRDRMGDEYVNALQTLWRGRVRAEADLCCYWFEKARAQIQAGRCRRAGLLATQGIRGGASREVLQRIKDTGDIFFAESDRPWVLDGANVHVSMVGFDDKTDSTRTLDGKPVRAINPNLTSVADVTRAKRLKSNASLSFMADIKVGPFDCPEEVALAMLTEPNSHGRPNSDVLVPWRNGMDVTGRPRNVWIIDFGTDMPLELAARYERPFAHIEKHAKPMRERNRMKKRALYWWIHGDAAPRVRRACLHRERYLATAMVAKHRLFVWLTPPILPDHQLIVFARSDDYFFGVLHSRIHEVWARALGTQLRERESGFRYTPTTCFETFPFPDFGGTEGSTGLSRSTGVSPVNEESGLNHGRDGRATGDCGAEDHGRDGRATAPSRIPTDGLIHTREGARLPHWTLAGATYFVTFRLADSLPASVLDEWNADRAALESRTADPSNPLSENERSRLAHLMSEKVQAYLDAGHGSCCLMHEEAASAVQDALLHFDGERYDLLAWAVMPNHVHVVVQPRAGHDLPGILHSWKSFTSHKVNALLAREGGLWQPEYYDHLIRDEADLERCIEYTYTNPERASLRGWRWCGVGHEMAMEEGSTGVFRSTGVPCSTGVSPVNEESGLDHGRDGRATQGGAADAAVAAIAAAAKELDELRNNWLNPPEWTRTEVLEFPGSVDGPWSRFVHDPDERGIGTVRYPRLVPKDDACAKKLAERTLTNLYNERPAWLELAHRKLDEAVFAAYGWDPGLSDDEILERLLELNLVRA